jgi:hypothetical protein
MIPGLLENWLVFIKISSKKGDDVRRWNFANDVRLDEMLDRWPDSLRKDREWIRGDTAI